MAVRNPPSFLQNITLVASGHTAQNDRLTIGSAFAPGAAALSGRSGILPGPAGGVGEVSVLSNTLVRVKPFRAAIQGSRSAAQGQYLVANDADVDLTIGGQSAGVSRKDLIIVNVRDSAFSPDTLDSAALQVVAGTPAASNPAEPTLGGVNLGNYLILGVANVPATGSSVTFTPRTDLATVAAGGVLPAALLDTALPAYDGHMRWHPTLGPQVGVAGVWMPATPQLPRLDVYVTPTVTGQTGAVIPWTTVITGQTTPAVSGSPLTNEWFTFDVSGRRILLKRAGLYALDLSVTTDNAAATQYAAICKVPTASTRGDTIEQDGGKANYGMFGVHATARLAANEYVGAFFAAVAASSLRADDPPNGVRTHMSVTRLSD